MRPALCTEENDKDQPGGAVASDLNAGAGSRQGHSIGTLARVSFFAWVTPVTRKMGSVVESLRTGVPMMVLLMVLRGAAGRTRVARGACGA